jgi:hypothetical protein
VVACCARQIVAARLCAHNKTACSALAHCLVAIEHFLRLSWRDGLSRGAGDGARTRDSLLGRQGVTRSPLARYRSAVGGDRAGIPKFDAALTKAFAFPWHKISRTFPDGIRKPRA